MAESLNVYVQSVAPGWASQDEGRELVRERMGGGREMGGGGGGGGKREDGRGRGERW